MYKRNSIKKLGKKTSHRKALIKNLLRSILQSGKVETSSVKAKVLKGELESVLSKTEKKGEGDISFLRELYKIFGKKELVDKAFELAKKKSVKVTIKKSGFRNGDNTELSTVEIVGFKGKAKATKKVEETKEKEEVEKEEKELPEEVQKNIVNIGRKKVSKKIGPIKKERARTRSGL